MKLRSVHVENFRAIGSLTVPLDPALTVLHGNNAHGKTSLLAAIALGLGMIPRLLEVQEGIEFRPTDLRVGSKMAFVNLVSTDCEGWSRAFGMATVEAGSVGGTKPIREYIRRLMNSFQDDPKLPLPVIAYYDTDRAVFDIPNKETDFRGEFHRYDAYVNALTAKTSFKTLVEWFYTGENRELRAQRNAKNFDLKLPGLEAVRNAIASMMGDVSAPHIEHPIRFVVERRGPGGTIEKLSLDQLSGGYRIVLAMVADLALRMAIANPHLPDPLQSEAIVLIDEIELHLHPEWQQRILSDLRRTFPNAQFIVSTHSPQVLTTVEPKHIVHLRATDGGIVAEQETGPTFGAKAGNVLRAVMGVDERPPENEFTKLLNRYQAMIAEGAGESAEARQMRADLERLSLDPQLAALDIEIARHRVMRELAAKG